ncbi:TetR/AcrR family transcriptional regulator [Micromonospora sediminimaris]|uniref:TetR family transcriptional regulator n=1 Tax=Micromonospora sediminimaris TaxID=547162 RepID=A0A9W5UVJ1_9ACTN|nr:helix-turn-helix domain-containing protein [Micromonospora sediminimaris]GIJ35847.1 TetR family transcriptional regulator [Micromonospora sediminimaris]SFC50590.1 transcriptional regulator, TetR family [Micromonospora sediminimaris]
MTEAHTRPQRSDWQRNHMRLVAVAAALVAQDGAQVSLEKIAREAGVGSATLHRHFPSRHTMLEEVFQDSTAHLRRRAAELAGEDPHAALLTWLEELMVAAASTRGLAAALDAADSAAPYSQTCHSVVREATADLLGRAHHLATVRPDVSPDDLIALVQAIAQATEGDPPRAVRLLRLALDGVRPR